MDTFKKIFITEDSFYKHLCLFSLSGIMSIGLLYFLSRYHFKIPMSSIAVKSSVFEAAVGFFAVIFLYFLLSGYIYKLSNLNLNKKFNLEEIHFNDIKFFVKIIPIIFTWTLYFLIIDLLAKKIIVIGLLGMLLQIFSSVIFVIFSKDFKLEKKYFNPTTIFKIIPKMIINVSKIFVILFVIFIILMSATSAIAIMTTNLEFSIATSIRILWGSFLIYIFWLSNILFVLFIGDKYKKDEFLHKIQPKEIKE